MIGKSTKSSRGKPCSCADGKPCEGCKNKQMLKPQIFLEEPRRLTIPIVISHYRPGPATVVQTIQRPRRWAVRHKPEPTTQPTVKKPTKVCQWYKRKQALRQLKEYEKKEQRIKLQNLQEQERRERELQLLEHYRLKEKTRPIYTSDPSSSYTKPEKVNKAKTDRKAQKRAEKERLEREKRNRENLKLQEREANYPFERGEVPVSKQTKVKVEKTRKVKTNKTAWAKPKAASRSVSVKRQYDSDSISNRFVNCFYRVCCQFYCYLTCILIIGCIIVFIMG